MIILDIEKCIHSYKTSFTRKNLMFMIKKYTFKKFKFLRNLYQDSFVISFAFDSIIVVPKRRGQQSTVIHISKKIG